GLLFQRACQNHGTVGRFGGQARLFAHVDHFHVHVPVGGMGMKCAAALKNVDVAVDGVQLFNVVDAGDAQRAVHRSEMFEVNTVRNMDDVFDRDLHAFVLRVACGDGNGVGLGVDLNGDTLEIGLAVLGNLNRVHFYRVAIPALYLDCAVDVLQLKAAARRERIGLLELLADGPAGRCPSRSHGKDSESRSAQSVTEHGVTP